MNKTEIIQSLIKEAEQLPDRNQEQLRSLLKKIKLFIRKVYGDSSNYLQDIDTISFYSGVFDFSADADKRAWLSGKSELVYLLQFVLSDSASSTTAEPLPRGIDVSGRQKYSNRIFIVHGRSNEMKEGLARVLEKLGLE